MLEEKVCIVTGSGGGIGRATAVEMARQGARVVVSDVDEEGGAETVAEVEAAGGEAAFVPCDVREEAQVEALMSAAAERFGGIDVLHNNAGVHETYFTEEATLEQLPTEVWMRVMEINLRGPWLAIKHAAPYLRRSKRGPNVVNAASIGGLTGYSPGSAYCSTKGGLIQLTRSAAIELAPEVRVNSYCPGSTDTYMVQRYYDAAEDREAVDRALLGSHLIPRLGEPTEIAKLVCFLASDAAAWITGSNYVIDGGAMAWRGTH